MEATLDVIYKVLLVIGLLAGLLAVPLGLSGNFILVGVALLYDLAHGFDAIGIVWLVVFLAAAIVGEVIESFLGVVAARRYGAGRPGMIGAFIGGIAGAVLGSSVLPIIGTILGSFAGAFAGALAGELVARRQDPDGFKESARAGWGAFLGRILAIAIKTGIGIAIVLIVVVRAFFAPSSS